MAKPDHMRAGDFAPVIRRTAIRGGAVVPLTAGTVVRLRLRRDGESTVTEYTGEVESASEGVVRYAWGSGEPISAEEEAALADPVIFWATFELEVPGVGRISIPTIGEDALVVHPRGP